MLLVTNRELKNGATVEKIDQLKKLFLESESRHDIMETLKYYVDLLEKRYFFSSDSNEAIYCNKHPNLSDALDSIKRGMKHKLNKKVKLLKPRFYEISERCFIHGKCTVREVPLPLEIFYFSDVKAGLVVLNWGKTNTRDILHFAITEQS